MPLSLKELANQLSYSDCKLQRAYGVQCSSKYGKGIYPYEWMNSVTKLNCETFPAYEDFQNSLAGLPSREDYSNALKYFNSKCKTFRDYHLYYLKSDVLILADGLAKFSAMIHDTTGIYLTRAVSIPQASYAGLWRENKAEVPYIVDPAMYDICKNACKGGLNIVAKCITEVTNHLQEHVMYWDIKSVYPKAMSEPLPSGNFQWLEEPTVEKLLHLCSSIDLKKQGALVVVGILFPAHTHDNLRDFPPLYEKRIFPLSVYPAQYPVYQKKKTIPKLIAHLATTWSYTCTLQELLIITNLGGKICGIEAIITYDVEPFCITYIEKLRHLCQQAIAAGNRALSLFIKLLMNSIYGKIYQDESKYLDVKIVTTVEDFEKVIRSPRYKSAIFNEYNVITTQRKKTNKKSACSYSSAYTRLIKGLVSVHVVLSDETRAVVTNNINTTPKSRNLLHRHRFANCTHIHAYNRFGTCIERRAEIIVRFFKFAIRSHTV